MAITRALHSGFQLRLEDFKHVVESLPGLKEQLSKYVSDPESDADSDTNSIPDFDTSLLAPETGGPPAEEYMHYWIMWRNRLPAKERKYIPGMQCALNVSSCIRGHSHPSPDRYYPGTKHATRYRLNRKCSHVFFPLRWVSLVNQEQKSPDHPGYKSLCEPTEEDQKCLQNFVGMFRRRGGELDMEKFEWSFMEGLHPSLGFKTVCLHCHPPHEFGFTSFWLIRSSWFPGTNVCYVV